MIHSKIIIYLTVLTIFITSSYATNDQYCRALVFEGGQDLGAWQAGVVKGLVETAAAEDI